MVEFDRLYIGGDWRMPSRPGAVDVVDPATERVCGRVPDGGIEDVNAAVRAAAVAFDAWAATPARDRGRALARLAEALRAREANLARVISTEMGAPWDNALDVQTRLAIEILESYVELAGRCDLVEHIAHSDVWREPVGVVAAITPWNYPLYQILAKLAPALAAGCTVVLKPSADAPLNAFLLADAVQAADLPAGVVNVVTGAGAGVGGALAAQRDIGAARAAQRDIGAALAAHRDVNLVSFTGSTRVGALVAAAAADRVARVALELGGKSAAVVLPDADLEAAVQHTVANVCYNTGQTCTAFTRLLVPADRQADVLEIAAAATASQSLGDPRQAGAHLGPIGTGRQYATVLEYLDVGVAEGATVAAGGPGPPAAHRPAGFASGWWVRPTVFGDVRPDMRIAQDEIFGPVLCVMPYRDEADAIRIANGTQYGLAGAVWSGSIDNALRMARRLRAGRVDINGAAFNPLAPTGGCKRSGYGRELGHHGLAEYLQLKSVQVGGVTAPQ